MKKLSELSCGDEAIISKIGSSGSLRRRMIDMGVTSETKVKIVKYAPCKDPIEIKIHDYKLSIRKSEADEIMVCEKDVEDIEIKNKFKERNFTFRKENNSQFISANFENERVYKAALVGNPNCGKTTLFNKLTGSYQYVGNWPGVTVERKEGKIKNISDKIDLVDLPGIYSLSPYSPEEIVTRNYIINESPDVIINILDATNLERNLYLTTQLLEMDFKVIIVLNMSDLLKNKVIDLKELQRRLGVPVVAVSAGKNKGIDKLLELLSLYVKRRNFSISKTSIYSSQVERALENIDNIIREKNVYEKNSRFKTIKVFEEDCMVLHEYDLSNDKLKEIENIRNDLSKTLIKEKDIIIPEERYTYIYELCRRCIRNISDPNKKTFSEKIDVILTGKHTSFLCFIAIIFSMFYITFGPIGVFFKEICENFINTKMQHIILSILNYIGVSSWLKSLMIDAVIRGVGSVISFLPQIILLFTLMSILEDSGYMSRVAFIMDKPMRKIGLSGKAFVPLLMGFGCSVPAVMGTQILESKKDKNLTIFLIPFMSCSAKMPIYFLFASIFFPNHQTFFIFFLYLFGVVCACFTSFIFKDSMFSGEDSHFIMEMPEYKLPSFRNVRLSVWDNIKDFIERAGTIILMGSVIIWFLQYFGTSFTHVSDNTQSILGIIGKFIAPIFTICGFNNWKVSVALITGLMAKESVVSTLSVLSSNDLRQAISQMFSFASSISFMVFVLLYCPCVAAVSAIYKEYKEKKYAFFSVIYQMVIAYVMSAFVYQIINLFMNIFAKN